MKIRRSISKSAAHPLRVGGSPAKLGAAIAHELNGPMTALLLYVGDIQHSIDLLDDRSLNQVADHAVLEAERICCLIA
jgi:signal transduction histidine kinase